LGRSGSRGGDETNLGPALYTPSGRSTMGEYAPFFGELILVARRALAHSADAAGRVVGVGNVPRASIAAILRLFWGVTACHRDDDTARKGVEAPLKAHLGMLKGFDRTRAVKI
jgi:hypothetical protein